MKLRRSDCPLVLALDLFGDRWTLLVIRDLFLGKQRFDEFLSSPEHVATNILADRLKHLIEHALVERLPDKEDKRRYLYHLTPLGQSTRRFLLPMIRWSSHHPALVRRPNEMDNTAPAVKSQKVARK